MLHSCFQVLKDFLEKELPMEQMDKEENKEFIEEVEALHTWWILRNQEDSIEDYNEDNEMLLRLLKIRCQLWT